MSKRKKAEYQLLVVVVAFPSWRPKERYPSTAVAVDYALVDAFVAADGGDELETSALASAGVVGRELRPDRQDDASEDGTCCC